MVAAKLADLKRGQHPDPQICGSSTKQAAAALNVSSRSVESAKLVTEQCSVAVQRAVRKGEVSVSDAAAVAGLPGADQDRALQAVRDRKARTLSAAVAPKPDSPPAPKPAEESVQEETRRTPGAVPAPSRNGSIPFDWRAWDRDFGPVARVPEAIVKAYPGEKDGDDYGTAVRLLQEFVDHMRAWRTRLQGVRG